jgi:hypothetical protein
MIEYIYFIKCPSCPECHDEHFYYFDEAKARAMNFLSHKPIITQVEADYNDFHECTDSCDLGTVWSWEDMMKDVPADPEHTVFTKADTVGCSDDFDPEFDDLDNSFDTPTERKPVPAEMTVEQLVEEMEENEDTVECKWCNELFDKSECRYEVDLGWLCDRCQAAIKSRGEMLTFREGALDESFNPNDYVEFEYDNLHVTLYGPKRDVDDWDEAEDVVSYILSKKKSDVFETILDLYATEEDAEELEGGLDALNNTEVYNEFFVKRFDDLFDKYYDKLLDRYREEATEEYESKHSLSEAMDPRELVELEYPSLTVTLYGSKRDVDDWDEVEHTTSHVFLVPKVEVATAIWENWITEEDTVDVEGGLEALEDDKAWEQFLETHFDALFEKYNAQILEYFREEATEDFRERSQEEYQMNQLSSNIDRVYDEWRDERYFGESVQKPFLEEFDDAETHKANLTDCPECGTVSYDMKEQYCSNCGLGL